MSEKQADDSLLPTPLRTVTPPSRTHRDSGMDMIGWVILAGMLIILLPVLPFVLAVWLLAKVTDALAPGSS